MFELNAKMERGDKRAFGTEGHVKQFLVKGMVCNNCAGAIERELNKVRQIKSAEVSYDERTVTIEFVSGQVMTKEELNALIESQGYIFDEVRNTKQTALVAGGIVSILIMILISRNLGFSITPNISSNMSYLMLFIAGVLTSFHCVAMCGGIAMTQSIGKQTDSQTNKLRAIQYNGGRIVSYTLLGGLIGAIGSVVSVGGTFRGVVSIVAGLFMVLLSLNLMGLVKIKLPKLSYSKKSLFKSQNGPFIVGLANGFMPCGPLQTMQLYALGTGSVIGGMSSMFFFSLGTVPLMLGLGLFTGSLSKNGGRRFVQASSVLVLVLGLIMVNRGLLLGGYGVSLNIGMSQLTKGQDNLNSNQELIQEDVSSNESDNTNEVVSTQTDVAQTVEEPVAYQIVDGVQVVQMVVKSDRYILSSPLVAGIPARIELDIQGINRCNSPVLIPKAGVEVDLLRNEPIMEFTPQELGDLKITCWMGMITTNASIVEALPNES